MKMNCRKTTAAHLPMPAGITYGNQQENLAVIIKGCRQAGFRKFINFPARYRLQERDMPKRGV